MGHPHTSVASVAPNCVSEQSGRNATISEAGESTQHSTCDESKGGSESGSKEGMEKLVADACTLPMADRYGLFCNVAHHQLTETTLHPL